MASCSIAAFVFLVMISIDTEVGGDAGAVEEEATSAGAQQQPVTAPRVRGVAPSDWAGYDCSSLADDEVCMFNCPVGPKREQISLPIAVLNDNFCDCADGSDEPGTAACAGDSETLFFCENLGGIPRYVYTSRVRDGVCDCCDGSDEAGIHDVACNCSNTCAAEGAERMALLKRLEQGLEVVKTTRQAGKRARVEWEEELNKLKQDLPELISTHEAAETAAKESVPEAVAKRLEELHTLIQTMQKSLLQQQDMIERLRVRQDALDAENKDLRAKLAGAPSEVSTDAGSERSVSEYAKWMDKPAEVIAPGSSASSAVATVTPSPGVEKPIETAKASDATLGANLPSVAQALEKVEQNKNRTVVLERYLQNVPDDKAHFYSLMDKCLSKTVGEYTYEICFFDNARQGDVSLGEWSGWTSKLRAEFVNGTRCWNGPERKLKVRFRCGAAEEISEVDEPSSCVYEAVVLAPGACGKKTAAEVERGMVDLKPRMPKDEL